MNIIGKIHAQIMRFNQEIEEELFRMAKHIGIKVEYYNGFIIMFDKVNVHALIPHRIVFSKNDEYLLVLYYDE